MSRGHFETEAYWQLGMVGLPFLVGLIVAICGVTCFPQIERARITDCQERHGFWDSAAGTCTLREPIPGNDGAAATKR